MKTFKLPVENVVGFTIGDIYVDVEISFKPVSRPSESEEIAIDAFNQRLGSLAWEIKNSTKEIVEKALENPELLK